VVSQKDPVPSGLLRNYSRFDESANIRTCAPIGKNQPILQVDPPVTATQTTYTPIGSPPRWNLR